MTDDYVLDASALLAFLNAEAGADRVAEVLLNHRCAVLAVNLTEVLSRLLDWQVPLSEAVTRLDALDFRTEPYTRTLALDAAALRDSTRAIGLSLADRACLALAQSLGATALTADRAWGALNLDCRIEVIR